MACSVRGCWAKAMDENYSRNPSLGVGASQHHSRRLTCRTRHATFVVTLCAGIYGRKYASRTYAKRRPSCLRGPRRSGVSRHGAQDRHPEKRRPRRTRCHPGCFPEADTAPRATVRDQEKTIASSRSARLVLPWELIALEVERARCFYYAV